VFEAIEKTKRAGVILLERIEDYLELFHLDLQIQQHSFIKKAISFAIVGVCSFIAFVFLGFAIVVSFWDTPYRIPVAWCVFVLYIAMAVIAFLLAKKHAHRESAVSTLSHELQQDIKLIKELL